MEKPEVAQSIRQELTPALRKFSPGRFSNLSDIVEHLPSASEGFSYKNTHVKEPFGNVIKLDRKVGSDSIAHELSHEFIDNQLEGIGPEIKSIKSNWEGMPFGQRYSYTQDLKAPSYFASKPSELFTELISYKMLGKEIPETVPKKIRDAIDKVWDKYKVVPLAAGGAAAGAALTPEESEAAISLKTPIKLAKESAKTLKEGWDVSETAKYLVGKVWNNRRIIGVYKPKPSATSMFEPGHPDYKPPTRPDKRAVVFEDGHYNMLDVDDLKTVVNAIGSGEYMKKVNPKNINEVHGKGIQSLRMKNWMNIGHDSLEEAEKMRKSYARNWLDLFGDQGIGIETIKYLGKYRNIASPYVDVLRETVPKILKNLEDTIKEYKKALKPVPRAIMEKYDELRSIKFLANQSTYISKYGFKGRNWTTPEGWEDING